MTIWEYKTLSLPITGRDSMLSEMGLTGWELIGFEQGLAYFKRPGQAKFLSIEENAARAAATKVQTQAPPPSSKKK